MSIPDVHGIRRKLRLLCRRFFPAKQKRSFYQTLILIEMLTETPYDPPSVSQIAYDMAYGDASGSWHIKKQIKVDGPTIARLLNKQGSDPTFFGLDEKGKELSKTGEEEDEGN